MKRILRWIGKSDKQMRVIKKIPRNAVYDYVTVIGDKRYHTKKRVYMVERVNNFGEKPYNIIRSYDNDLN